MQGDSNNPNEVILIPLLNKRVTDLYTQNILLEGKLLWAEKQAEEAREAHRGELESAQQSVASRIAAVEGEKQAAIQNAEADKQAAIQKAEADKQAIRAGVDAEKTRISENWQREMDVQTGVLRGQISTLTNELQAANAKIGQLENELRVLRQSTVPVVTQPEPQPKGKTKGRKTPVVLGGDTY